MTATVVAEFDDRDDIEVDNDLDDISDIEAAGGKLSQAGRREAIAAALSLVGVYFSKGRSTGLEDKAAVQRAQVASTETETLLAALRLRTAIAATHKLTHILDRINRRPNFRYNADRAESVGRIVGRLDVLRYSRQRSRVTSPPTYPVIDISRGIQTAENTLAYSAGLLILRELNAPELLAVFPVGGPEHREARIAAAQIRRYLQGPAFLACKASAHETLRFNTLRRLNARVHRRVVAGHVGNAGPYKELTEWVDGILSGAPVAKPGDIDWSFYGDAFDTKLYELWCLSFLAKALSERISVEPPSVGADWRKGGATYEWRRPAGLLELRFQQSLPQVSRSGLAPQWSRLNDSGKRVVLGGVPDITARSVLADGTEQIVILDPKLRQRGSAPTEELYKMLGYFENYGISENPRGVILFYTTKTSQLPAYSYSRESDSGALLAVGLNPAAPGSSLAAIQPVVDLLLQILGIAAKPSIDGQSTNTSDAGEMVIASRLSELRQFSAVLGMSLQSSKERMAMILGEPYWNALSDDLQVVLATSEHVGFTMDPLGDFSAAVIGLCAGLESLVDAALVGEVRRTTSGLKRFYTFGQTVSAMRKGLRGDTSDVFASAIKNRIDELTLDLPACVALVEKLQHVIDEYRNPAAHKESLSKAKWRSAWRDTLGEGGLYKEAMDVLNIRASNSE